MTFEFDKEQIKNEALEKHEKLSTLFKENRFMFEVTTKKQIQEFIKSSPPEYQQKLRELQATWDGAMNGAGKHNRLVLAKSLFMDNFINNFQPSVNAFSKEFK